MMEILISVVLSLDTYMNGFELEQRANGDYKIVSLEEKLKLMGRIIPIDYRDPTDMKCFKQQLSSLHKIFYFYGWEFVIRNSVYHRFYEAETNTMKEAI